MGACRRSEDPIHKATQSPSADAKENTPSDVALQLHSADNFNSHFCPKFGPLLRPGNCSDTIYADANVGPFAVVGARWDDWVLDPGRRMCITLGDGLCGYDVR